MKWFSDKIPAREFDSLSGVSLEILELMRRECLEELDYAPLHRRPIAANLNGLTAIRLELSRRRYGPDAGLTPPADAGLAGNPVANTEAPAVSREVGQA